MQHGLPLTGAFERHFTLIDSQAFSATSLPMAGPMLDFTAAEHTSCFEPCFCT